MTTFSGKTTFITGAASGIGLALAKHAAEEGMRVVLADIDLGRVEAAARQLDLAPENHLCLAGDVSQDADVENMARAAIERFGKIHYLFNNAGVMLGRRVWEYSAQDWAWQLGVNVAGVANGIRHFVPHMLAHGEPGRVVNTASVAGFLAPQGMAAYSASKAGVVAISEALREELAAEQSAVGVSVLCPAWVPTNISNAERARPAQFGTATAASTASDVANEKMNHAIAAGRKTADDIARDAFAGIRADRFYLFTHPRIASAISTRFNDIQAALAAAAQDT